MADIINTAELLNQAFTHVDQEFSKDIPRIESGIEALDNEIGGFRINEICMLISDKEKEAVELITKILLYANSYPHGFKVNKYVHNPFCDTLELGLHALSTSSGIPYQKLRFGHLTDQDWIRLNNSIHALSNIHDAIYIGKKHNFNGSVSSIEMHIKHTKRKHFSLVLYNLHIKQKCDEITVSDSSIIEAAARLSQHHNTVVVILADSQHYKQLSSRNLIDLPVYVHTSQLSR